MEYVLDAEITSVTVYPNQARITLSGELELESGSHKVIFDELPLSLLSESVRVSGQGHAKVRLMSVDVRRTHYEQTPIVKVRELEDQIEQLQDEIRGLEDEQAVQEAQVGYLDGLRRASKQYARGLAFARTKVEDQAAIARFFEEHDLQLRSSMRELGKRKRGLNRQVDKLQRELNSLKSARPKERFQAIVDLEVFDEGTFRPELSYVVNSASWKPLYDIRLIELGSGPSLQITNIAQVTQRTGQDWNGVALVVSTARPMLSQRIPELNPWYIDEYQPPQPMPRMLNDRQPDVMAAAVTTAAELVEPVAPQFAVQVEEVAADVALAQVQENESIISYQVPGDTDIPSDGTPHKVTLSQFELDPEIDYLAVPKRSEAVFRRVKALNGSAGPMLAGPVNLFVGDEYVGSSSLDYIAKGEEIELSLGVEERITVDRELTRRDVDKARLRDRRQLQYGYKIEIHNLLPTKVTIEIHDQIPVARHEDIKVKPLHLSPDPTDKSELNVYEWSVDVPAGEELSLSYDFLVEHPRSMKIIGLID